jgi:polyisoprenoid-binding protein YceI
VKTGRTGAAAKAGHDLVIEVTAWQATLEVADDPSQISVMLDADATSLRVREGTGGMQTLDDADKASIVETINDDVLKKVPVEFRSTAVHVDGDQWSVEGELTLAGRAAPLTFELTAGEGGSLSGSAVIKQSDWGIKPYSALFGALKVADEVTVAVEAHLPPA